MNCKHCTPVLSFTCDGCKNRVKPIYMVQNFPGSHCPSYEIGVPPKKKIVPINARVLTTKDYRGEKATALTMSKAGTHLRRIAQAVSHPDGTPKETVTGNDLKEIFKLTKPFFTEE